MIPREEMPQMPCSVQVSCPLEGSVQSVSLTGQMILTKRTTGVAALPAASDTWQWQRQRQAGGQWDLAMPVPAAVHLNYEPVHGLQSKA